MGEFLCFKVEKLIIRWNFNTFFLIDGVSLSMIHFYDNFLT